MTERGCAESWQQLEHRWRKHRSTGANHGYNDGGSAARSGRSRGRRLCAPGEDAFGKPEAGYVADAAARVASVDWTKTETITVSLSEFAFSPSTLTFRVNAPYRLVLKNVGRQTHFFVSEGFFNAIATHKLRSPDAEVTSPYLKELAVAPGITKELLFVPIKPGTYELGCTALFHAGFGMTGTITIV